MNRPHVMCCDKGCRMIYWQQANNFCGPDVTGFCLETPWSVDVTYENISFCPWCGKELPQERT